MAPKGEEWTPTLVHPPEKNPEGRTFFDWNDEKLKKWKADAIKMQEVHIRDNNRTEWFAYKPEERDAIELRILMTLYGVRTPLDGTKGVPSCPLKTYTREQKLQARRIKKVIVKNSGYSEKIHFNVIYISTATKSEDQDEFLASEEPVFVVKKCRRFVDRDGRAYDNFDNYRQDNNLPRGPMLFPQNGNYTPGNNGGNDGNGDGRVSLVSGETPATSVFKRIKAVADTIVMVGGITLAVAGVVTCFAPAAFSATVISAMQTGSFFLTSYSTAGAIHSICDKTSRDESIETEAFVLISSALSSYTGFLRMKVGQYAREGKTYTEVLNKITRTQKSLFAAFNLMTFVSSASALYSSFVDLLNKKERTWLDYYQFCMSLFMNLNVLTKPQTIHGVFESKQLQYLNEIKKNLASEEAKQEMSTTVEQHPTSDNKAELIQKLNTIENHTDHFELQCLNKMKDNLNSEEAKQKMSSVIEQHSASGQKAYFIRNLKKVENPTEFFELINKTSSVVTCTSDGLTINDKIDISPEAYSEIGKAVFEDKINQITRSEETALRKNLKDEFGKYVSDEKQEAFEKGLEDTYKLPADQRKAAMKNLVSELQGDVPATEQDFNASWDNADQAVKEVVQKEINEMIDNLEQGSNAPEKKEDFEKLRDLARKRINGTIPAGENGELQEQVDKCSRHRKEHFFKSTAAHRDDINYDQRMDSLEKEVAGGKNLEEWKMAQRDLDNAFKNNKIREAEYAEQKVEIEKRLKQAEYARDYRNKADHFVNSQTNSGGGSILKNAFIVECEKALEKANKTGNPTDTADATEKLRIAREISTKSDADVIDRTKSFKNEINTFTNAKNERLCYRVDVDQVKSDLQHIYERPNVADITVNGKPIFANMKIGEYDRISRVLRDYKSNGKTLMTAAINIANSLEADPKFAGLVGTPHDIVSIAEAVNTERGSRPKGERPTYLNNLASGTGSDFDAFREKFTKRLEEVNALDHSIKSQWTNPLTMTYHWWKHENDFGKDSATAKEYFIKHANNLFTTENMTVQAHNQSGAVRQTYKRSFGTRNHIGFTVGSNHTITSHYAPE